MNKCTVDGLYGAGVSVVTLRRYRRQPHLTVQVQFNIYSPLLVALCTDGCPLYDLRQQ